MKVAIGDSRRGIETALVWMGDISSLSLSLFQDIPRRTLSRGTPGCNSDGHRLESVWNGDGAILRLSSPGRSV